MVTFRANLMPPEVPPKPSAPAPPPRRAVSQMALNSGGGNGKENLYSPDPENISPWRENSNTSSTSNGGLFTGTAGRRRGLQVFSGEEHLRVQSTRMRKLIDVKVVQLQVSGGMEIPNQMSITNISCTKPNSNSRKPPDPLNCATTPIQDLSAAAAPARPPQQQLQPPQPQRHHPHSQGPEEGLQDRQWHSHYQVSETI